MALEGSILDTFKYDERGLIPAIVQDGDSGHVLMMAWMNRTSLRQTIETGHCTFWSRSRGELWVKGAASGNVQSVRRIAVDCDLDALLISVEQTGPACHERYRSCFYRDLKGDTLIENQSRLL